MKTTRLFAYKFTQAEVDAGSANSLPSGSIVWVVDNDGVPTGKVYTASGGGVVEGGGGSSFREWQANTAYSQGQIAVAPSTQGTISAGDLIVRATQGTSGATFSATEASKWTEVADDPDLIKKADIVNNLTDTSTDKPLSAAQGKALQDGKAAATHNHDAAYEAKNTNIQTHITATTNPHGVTKSQVGLGNADNTADSAKPVSTAQQTALDGKSDTSHGHTDATGSAAGFMSAADKTKMDGLPNKVAPITGIAGTTDLNTLITTGIYQDNTGGSPVNAPATTWGWTVEVFKEGVSSPAKVYQRFFSISAGAAPGTLSVYTRHSNDNGVNWSAWKKIVTDNATTSVDGLMAATDKTKLDGISVNTIIMRSYSFTVTDYDTTVSATTYPAANMASWDANSTTDAWNSLVVTGGNWHILSMSGGAAKMVFFASQIASRNF